MAESLAFTVLMLFTQKGFEMIGVEASHMYFFLGGLAGVGFGKLVMCVREYVAKKETSKEAEIKNTGT